jgi:NDP-sugar pyrophosphorylase family protein
MKALILAGGKGSRLAPFTTVLPKPLMPVGGNMAILELLIRQLRAQGIVDLVLAIGYLGHLIQAVVGDGSKYGVSLLYSSEDTPLGTAGPLANIIDDLGERFLLMNGDLLTNLKIKRMISHHESSEADITVAAYRREILIDFGLLEMNEAGWLTGYREKPKLDHFVSMGLYVINRQAVLPYLNPGQYLDMPDLIKKVAGGGGKVACYIEDCFWLDIGRREDYEYANSILEKGLSDFLPGEQPQ